MVYCNKYLKYIFPSLAIAFSLSCRQSEKEPEITDAKSDQPIQNYIPPKITVLSDLPDSLQPKTILLKDRPKSVRIKIPKKHKNQARFIEQGEQHFTHYTTDNGLALDAVTSSAIDRSGNLWFGTDGGGVSRYDGKMFTNFSTMHGFTNDRMDHIAEDKLGNIWFVGIKKIFRYDGRRFQQFTKFGHINNANIYCISADRSGNIWIGTEKGLARFDGNRFINMTSLDGLVSDTVLSIMEDRSNNIWIGTTGGISKYDGKIFKNYTVKNGLKSNIVLSMFEDKSGNIWIGTEGGICRYNNDKFSHFPSVNGITPVSIIDIMQDKSGNLWFNSVDNGLYVYDGIKCTNFSTEQGLTNNTVTDIKADRSGQIWISTYGGGVIRYDGNSFTNYSSVKAHINFAVKAVLEDRTGKLWFGSYEGLSCFDGTAWINYAKKQGLAGNYISSLIEDKSGKIWIGTSEGVSCYDGIGFTNYTTVQGLADNFITYITEDKFGNLWFATYKGGLSRFDGTGFTNFSSLQGLPGILISCITEDSIGNLWLGSFDGGFCWFDGERFINFDTIHGLTNNTVWDIIEDRSQNMWIATVNGLSIVSQKENIKWANSLLQIKDNIKSKSHPSNQIQYPKFTFNSFTTEHGLPDNTVIQLYQLSDGKIAAGTNYGIGILSSVDSTANMINNAKEFDIEVFNSSTGYPVKDLNWGKDALFQDSKGIIWAGTGNNKTNLVRFDYSSLIRNEKPPVLALHGIRLNERPICWNDLKSEKINTHSSDQIDLAINICEEATTLGRVLNDKERLALKTEYKGIRFDSITPFYPAPINLTLDYRFNRVSFEYGSNEIARPNLVQYRYMLEGYDDDWSPILYSTNASFGNIKEGKYTFKVKARFTGINSSGGEAWSEPLSYSFRVLPPWYRTWWAYTLYTLTFLSLLTGFIRWRLSSLKSQKVQLENQVSRRTRELRDANQEVEKSLSELKNTQQELIQKEKMASLGELTAGIAHEIQNPLNFVNNFSEVNKELIGELKLEADKGNIGEVKSIANVIEDNDEKILIHGQRADAIVKSMLQHSRTGSGKKEPTDINALADEYLRLAYHGMRAKDKSFNATLHTDFDATLQKLNVIPQDIGRVLLNLFNNAFYAVNERSKEANKDYEPKVTVSTRLVTASENSPIRQFANSIIISVKDNGNGITDKIKDKIFQPFFTTKPTGKGTGLGLSLSYDMVKAHGGEIRVESKEGSGSEFNIQLPV